MLCSLFFSLSCCALRYLFEFEKTKMEKKEKAESIMSSHREWQCVISALSYFILLAYRVTYTQKFFYAVTHTQRWKNKKSKTKKATPIFLLQSLSHTVTLYGTPSSSYPVRHVHTYVYVCMWVYTRISM